tara:strand:- start:2513 stop:3172 length:660 start_codon:yes stop_codon:yes gene_type:complete
MNESDYKITPLWATPLFQSTLKNIPQECKDYIMKNVEYKRYPANNGFGSKSKFLLDIQALAPLKKVLTDVTHEYLYKILDIDESADFQMTNSWSVKHIKGDEAGQHHHANSMLSGILYLQTDEKTGDVLFVKERNHFPLFNDTIQIPFKGNNYNLYNVEGWAIKPRNNQLLLFPSQLRHEVYPNESDTERYCIAFNFFAFGKFGYDDQVQLGIKDVTRD